MKNIKLNTKRILLKTLILTLSVSIVITAIQLAACGIATPAPIDTATTMPTSTLVIPTSTEPPPTPSPTSTPSSIPISSPPEGLRMAYIIDGNLYFQDGSNPPLQLTHSGEDSTPIFSDDGERIVFFRGTKPPFDIYSINVDGGGEQAIMTTSQLMNLGAGYDQSTHASPVQFVPGTHRLLFSTYQFEEGSSGTDNGDLLVVNTDTAKIRKLLNYGSDFYVSPDGRFIAIDLIGSINVIDIDGNLIRQNLLTYTPSQPSFLPAGISWMSDSTALIILLPDQTYFEVGYIPSYTVWRYALESGAGVAIPLDPLPMEYYLAEVSPDGNWLLYDREDQLAFFLGDLRTGEAKVYESLPSVFHYDWSWSPDSQHFIYQRADRNLYVGSIDDSPMLIGKGDFMGWIDSKRYFYYTIPDKNIVLGEIDGEQNMIPIGIPKTFAIDAFFAFILP